MSEPAVEEPKVIIVDVVGGVWGLWEVVSCGGWLMMASEICAD